MSNKQHRFSRSLLALAEAPFSNSNAAMAGYVAKAVDRNTFGKGAPPFPEPTVRCVFLKFFTRIVRHKKSCARKRFAAQHDVGAKARTRIAKAERRLVAFQHPVSLASRCLAVATGAGVEGCQNRRRGRCLDDVIAHRFEDFAAGS